MARLVKVGAVRDPHERRDQEVLRANKELAVTTSSSSRVIYIGLDQASDGSPLIPLKSIFWSSRSFYGSERFGKTRFESERCAGTRPLSFGWVTLIAAPGIARPARAP